MNLDPKDIFSDPNNKALIYTLDNLIHHPHVPDNIREYLIKNPTHKVKVVNVEVVGDAHNEEYFNYVGHMYTCKCGCIRMEILKDEQVTTT